MFRLLVSLPPPPALSSGADSASQDTSLQSACEGGPCPWALCTLSLRPRGAHLSLTPGPLVDTHSCGQATWRFFWLQLEAACPDTRPQAEG